MELDLIHPQTQPQLKAPSTDRTTTINTFTNVNVLAHDSSSAPCSNFINDYKAFFDSLPPGYRFRPTKEELIKDYLLPKINGKILPPSHIRDVNLYKDSPDKITERYEADENLWYFFTPRDRKYPKGHRPNRAAGEGFWKATGADVKIIDNGKIIGYKKSLVYFVGKPPNGEKSNWIMHEYRAPDNDKAKKKATCMRLDDYVLCRIYKKNDQTLKGQSRETPSTSVKDCNNVNARESDSSRLMSSHNLMDASSGRDNFSSNCLVKEVTPFNYGYGQGYDQLLSSAGNKVEFEDLDLDNFDLDDHPLQQPHDL